METPASRLQRLRLKKGFKGPKSAADYHGWKISTYTQHENGNREISRKAASKYAEAYGSTMDYILRGKNPTMAKNNNSIPQDIASQPIMVLSLALIRSVGTKKEMLELRSQEFTYVGRKSGITGNARCVPVEDNSAIDVNRSHEESFRPGDEVIFDPGLEPAPGKLVIVYHPKIIALAPRIYAERTLDNGEVIVELVPINPAFRTVRMVPGDGSYICGVVIKLIRSV